jgi:hypothetical protein
VASGRRERVDPHRPRDPATALVLARRDYTKSPPWEGGEVVDICQVGAPLPLSTTVSRFGFTLERYWSNASGSCVG